jgi:hypothetical protein
MTQAIEFSLGNPHIALRHDSGININGFMLSAPLGTGRILRFFRTY